MSDTPSPQLTPEDAALIARVAAQAQPIFAANDWTYCTIEGGVRVPTTEQIERTLRRLSLSLRNEIEEGHTLSSGRFDCTIDDRGALCIRLSWEGSAPTDD